MKNSTLQRETHLKSGQWLRKARRRYILKVAPHIAANHSLLWDIAVTMKKRSLYATPMLSDIRWSILRTMHKAESKKGGNWDWWSWLLKNGWGRFGWRDAA